MLWRVLAVCGAAVSLAACATVRSAAPVAWAPAPPSHQSDTPLPTLGPPSAPAPSQGSETFAALPGWAEDDHAGALAAFAAGCRAAHDPDLAETCRQALAQGPLAEAEARRFLETH